MYEPQAGVTSGSCAAWQGCVTLARGAQDEDSPQQGWVGEQAEQLYANVLMAAAGPFDVTLIFGQQDNAARTRATPDVPNREVVRVAMSWAHLKSMIPLLARMVAEYETQMGEIPSPGFDQNWKE
jgi:hypothetical protein